MGFVTFPARQSSRWGRDSWLLYFNYILISMAVPRFACVLMAHHL